MSQTVKRPERRGLHLRSRNVRPGTARRPSITAPIPAASSWFPLFPGKLSRLILSIVWFCRQAPRRSTWFCRQVWFCRSSLVLSIVLSVTLAAWLSRSYGFAGGGGRRIAKVGPTRRVGPRAAPEVQVFKLRDVDEALGDGRGAVLPRPVIAA